MPHLIHTIKKIANSAYAPIKAKLKKSYRPKQYIKKYGREEGIKLYQKFNSGSEGEIVEYEIPNYPSPLFLRVGTSDEPTFRQVFMNIRYEIDLPFSPKTIIDGGSNIGYASVFYAKKYPKAEVLAIEPDSSNFEMVEKNTLNYPNIKRIQSAIWGKSTYLKIKNPETEKWAFEVIETTKNEEGAFEAFSIQDLINKMGWDSVDFLKLDIEGSEMSVFNSGYESWLPKVKLLIIELHERMQPGCTEVFEKAIGKYNFKKSISGENLVYINQEA
jgi:FkbM family methyltransferase